LGKFILLQEITAIIIATFIISGCTTSNSQNSGLNSNQNIIELCNNYLSEFDILFSEDVASLDKQKREYLIDLLYQINITGLTKSICQRKQDEASNS